MYSLLQASSHECHDIPVWHPRRNDVGNARVCWIFVQTKQLCDPRVIQLPPGDEFTGQTLQYLRRGSGCSSFVDQQRGPTRTVESPDVSPTGGRSRLTATSWLSYVPWNISEDPEKTSGRLVSICTFWRNISAQATATADGASVIGACRPPLVTTGDPA
jgi:hypothetical protein